MLFNSFVFVGFFLVVYSLYLLSQKNLKIQNLILLVGSLFFYGYWSVKFLILLIALTSIDFFMAQWLAEIKERSKKKIFLWISLAFNLSFLGLFKYFNFFEENVSQLLQAFGMEPDFVTLNLILPVGISFHTFQAMGYIIDVYREKTAPCKNFLDYILFITFFPQMMAGPIERASNLFRQIQSPRILKMDHIHAGLYLVLIGYFKKVVIADNISTIANLIFNNPRQVSGLDLVLGTVIFGIQIYCDFSGYTDIARGLAKFMGFDLMLNFNLPYFALNPKELWTRWHISLSTWIKDYVYIPLGGSAPGRSRLFQYKNILITMGLSGLWHGASWHFVFWGLFHGLILVLYHQSSFLWDRAPRLLQMITMFSLTMAGWIFFRGNNLSDIAYIFSHLSFVPSGQSLSFLFKLGFFTWPLVLIELWEYLTGDLLAVTKQRLPIKTAIYGFLFTWIFLFGVRESIEFIYFQF